MTKQEALTTPSGEQIDQHPLVLRLRDYATEKNHDPATLAILMDAARAVELLFEVYEASYEDWDSWLLSRSGEWTDEVSGLEANDQTELTS